MAAPIPSFFKIRCWLFIIAFLLFFMFLGMVKNVFACDPVNQSPPTPTSEVRDFKLFCTEAERDAYYASLPALDTFDSCSGGEGSYVCEINPDWDFKWRRDVGTVIYFAGLCVSDDDPSVICGSGDYFFTSAPSCDLTCGNPGDSDGDGLPDNTDPCPNNPDPDCKNPCSNSSDPDCKDSDGDGLPDDTDPCRNNPDLNCTNPCPEDDPDCDADGNGVPDVDEIPDYVSDVPSYGEGDFSLLFGERWNQFTDEIKDTSFFSIPSQITGDVGSGSEDSSIFIEGGETLGGTHEISFSNWTPGLAVLRGVLYAAACFIAVRIVTLKH